ncbi:MAG: peptidylprolyl isomerase [Planctomycetaceae bacterium]|nr:peptidylprolyl isomerase [Planctomycetaceae bacterium]
MSSPAPSYGEKFTMSLAASFSLWHLAVLFTVVGCALSAGSSGAAEPLPQVTLKTTKGDVVIELFEDEAPNTVANFISLVEKKYYDGVPFHRVIEGFMAQTGDPTGTGTGGPGYVIDCECTAPNARKHQRGTVAMAHRGPNTGGSQFYICFVPTPHLDGKHTVFGQVISGMENVDKLNIRDPRSGGPADKITEAVVTKKRDHEYKPKTNPSDR